MCTYLNSTMHNDTLRYELLSRDLLLVPLSYTKRNIVVGRVLYEHSIT